LLIALPATVPADQNDPGLEPLFAALAQARSAREAGRIEARIWQIWLDSGDPETNRLLRTGMAAFEAGRSRLALDLLDEVVTRAPAFAEGWNQRATAYYLIDDFDASLADIERVLELEPRHFGALSGRGLIYLAQGRDYDAMLAFQAVVELHPHAREARRYLQFLRQRLGAETV
ncbi:MAG TPA: tetratricopeptide repeat protein, partial [Steroidobacteraceae bacterium]|nr:tetratricopeptide repeat protein [Steroidobacteraceae bacterium]